MSFLASLILSIWTAIIGRRDDDHIAQGKAEQACADTQAQLNLFQAESQAAVDSPEGKKAMEKLLEEHKL